MDRKLSKIGVIATTIYLALIVLLVAWKACTLPSMPLNEIGDFLAGVFGPIAILWLILGFFQQGQELRQNNKALHMQAAELKASVQQQVAMVEAQRIGLSNFDKSLAPLLKLDPVNFAEIDGVQHLLVEVANLGEYCEKIEIYFEGDSYPTTIDALFKDDSKRVYVEVGDVDFDSVHKIKVTYVSRNGVAGVQEFIVQEYRDEDGADIFIAKLPFLS